MSKAEMDSNLGSRLHTVLESYSKLLGHTMNGDVEGIPRESFDDLREALKRMGCQIAANFLVANIDGMDATVWKEFGDDDSVMVEVNIGDLKALVELADEE